MKNELEKRIKVLEKDFTTRHWEWETKASEFQPSARQLAEERLERLKTLYEDLYF